MPRLFRFVLAFLASVVLIAPAFAKDKNATLLPADVVQARTVIVIVDPDSGEPIDHPDANVVARDNVEKALIDWGRFDLLTTGQQAELIIVVHKGNDKTVQPTIKGGPGGGWDTTDPSIRIGSRQQPQSSPNDPTMTPPNRGPHVSNEVSSGQDEFTVYRGNREHPLDAPPVWRYLANDCLSAPKVHAVEEFRKLIAKAEQAQSKKP